MGKFAAALAGIAALSVLLSYLAFLFDKLPLPLGRTGIYLVPLCTLVAGVIAAAPARSLMAQWMRRGITAVFICLACYFVLCIRMTYFREYKWDADLKDVYSELALLNHTYGTGDVATNGLYLSSLNYYRVLSKEETFSEFTLMLPDAPGRSIYVLNQVSDHQFIDKEKLAIVYSGKSTGVVVAVRPRGPISPQ